MGEFGMKKMNIAVLFTLATMLFATVPAVNVNAAAAAKDNVKYPYYTAKDKITKIYSTQKVKLYKSSAITKTNKWLKPYRAQIVTRTVLNKKGYWMFKLGKKGYVIASANSIGQMPNDNINYYWKAKQAGFVRLNKTMELGAYSTDYASDQPDKPIMFKKGIVIALSGFNFEFANGKMYNDFDFQSLNYKLANKVNSAWFASKAGIDLNRSDFTAVKQPTKITDQFMFKGTMKKPNTKEQVYVTADGYLEYYNRKSATLENKPTKMIKIITSRQKGQTTYLYLAKDLKNFKTTKISKSKYRLAVKRLKNTKKVIKSKNPYKRGTMTYRNYKIGGQAYSYYYSYLDKNAQPIWE